MHRQWLKHVEIHVCVDNQYSDKLDLFYVNSVQFPPPILLWQLDASGSQWFSCSNSNASIQVCQAYTGLLLSGNSRDATRNAWNMCYVSTTRLQFVWIPCPHLVVLFETWNVLRREVQKGHHMPGFLSWSALGVFKMFQTADRVWPDQHQKIGYLEPCQQCGWANFPQQ